MIYLVKPTGDVLGSLNGLKEETCNVKRVLTDMWELSFEVNKYIDEKEFKKSDYYDSISEKMQIWLQTDLIDTMFVIDSEPVISNNGIQETKTITAHTLESELQYKILRLFYINNGNSTSKEYLAKDNINSYTQLPNEYISLVNFENPELSLLHLVLEGTEWSVDENLKTIEPEMCDKKFTFSVDEQDIYSFLMNTIAPTAQIIFFFDRKTRIVSFRSFDNLGKDTGIFIGLRNLAQQIDIESTSESGLITKYKPTCSENLGVEYVNFGDPYIYNLDYFANTHNEYGDYKYVTESFHDEYVAWITKRNDNRQQFIDLTKEYNQNLIKIDELKNRLPNDGCSIDYKTFKSDELYFSLNAYENALATLITLYKEDYPEKYTSSDVELDEEHLKTTMYWYDYYSYKYQIIPSVLEAMKIWYETDSNGNLIIGDDGKYIVCENGNPAYANNIDIIKPVDSFKYEFELYGLDELQSKKKAWMECVNLLYKDGFITKGTRDNPTQYNTPDENGWNSLTSEQKNQFTSITAYKETLNNYLDYMSLDVRENSITQTECKGIIRQCEDAIEQRQHEIDALQSANGILQEQRNALSSSVLPENNFSSDNLKIFRLLIHEANYSNENIVVTSLDDILSKIDIAEELYNDGYNDLAIVSQPQYSFKTTIDNLFALEEFTPLHKDMDIGNFIRLMPDMFSDDFVKLRIISIETNPLINTPDISIEFSTMTKSLSDMTDLTFLFDEKTSGGTSESSSSSSSGTYGKNDAEIQIANNMLNALLKTETFGTQVSDVILDSISGNKGDFKKLLAHSGIFDSLEAGTIKINSACLVDMIKSENYSPNETGSMFNLKDGSIDFAGGSLTYDKDKGLVIRGEKGKTSIDGSSVNTGALTSNNYNGTVDNPLDNTEGSIIDLTDGQFNFGGGKLKFEEDTLFVEGDVTANNLVANESGTIAGWHFDQTGFYKVDENNERQMVLGDDGISAGEGFSVSKDGLCNLNNVSKMNIGNITINEGGLVSYNPYNKYERLQIQNGNMYIPTNILHESTKPESFWGIGYSFDHSGIRIYDNNNSISYFLYKYADLSMNNLKDGAYLSLEAKYELDGDINISGKYHYKTEYNAHGITGKIKVVSENSDATVDGGNVRPIDPDDDVSSTYDVKFFSGFDEIDTSYDEEFEYGLNIVNTYLLSNILSSGSQLRINNYGMIGVYSSSSKKYKNNITDKISPELDPALLYKIPVVQFRYNDDYLSKNDQRYGKNIIGFLAEDIYENYPIACNLKDGEPEVPEYNMLIAPMLKLIQEQHEEIENLKKRIEALEQKI